MLSVLWSSLFLQASFKYRGPYYTTDSFSVPFGQQRQLASNLCRKNTPSGRCSSNLKSVIVHTEYLCSLFFLLLSSCLFLFLLLPLILKQRLSFSLALFFIRNWPYWIIRGPWNRSSHSCFIIYKVWNKIDLNLFILRMKTRASLLDAVYIFSIFNIILREERLPSCVCCVYCCTKWTYSDSLFYVGLT